MITDGFYLFHSVSFAPFEPVFRRWWLQIAKKNKKKLENCKIVRKDGERLAMRVHQKVVFLGGARVNLSSSIFHFPNFKN